MNCGWWCFQVIEWSGPEKDEPEYYWAHFFPWMFKDWPWCMKWVGTTIYCADPEAEALKLPFTSKTLYLVAKPEPVEV